MRLASRVTILVFAAGWAAIAPRPGFALVVADQTGTTSAPSGANDPGWSNVTTVARNFIYLGDGWALSAKHVGPEPSSLNQTLSFSSGSADIIPGQNYVVPNPGGVPSPTTGQLNLESDLRLVRLRSEVAETSSIFDTNPQFTIASQALTLSNGAVPDPNTFGVTFIGHGRTRASNLSYWDSGWHELTFQPGYVPMASEYAYSGYKSTDPNDDTKRWGTNVIADENPIFGHSDTDLRVTFRNTQGDGVTRDTVSIVTQFDANGLTNEAQAVDKDSGSAVFQQRMINGQLKWQLIGIVNANYTLRPDTNPDPPNQPLYSAVHGNLTTFADLSFYNGSNPQGISVLQNIFDSHPHYSVIGDLDLDGNFQNDLTDDLAAFVAGWGYVDPLGKATYASWAKGDVAHPLGVGTCKVSLGNGVCAGGDGKTDVYDFIAIRDELNDPAAGAGLAVMLGIGGSSGVPEPTSMALAVMSAVFVGLSGRSRRRRHLR